MWLGHLRLPSSWKAYAFLSAWVTAVVKLDWDQGVLKKKKKKVDWAKVAASLSTEAGITATEIEAQQYPGPPQTCARAHGNQGGQVSIWKANLQTLQKLQKQNVAAQHTHCMSARREKLNLQPGGLKRRPCCAYLTQCLHPTPTRGPDDTLLLCSSIPKHCYFL